MIINISRTKSFQSCRQFAYNWDELRLASQREADPLIIGEAYHLGSEIITQSASVEDAVKATEQRMRERYVGQLILPEERPEIERNIEWAKAAVQAWALHYDKADFRVLWPEVNGCVPLPGTEHHCFFAHRILYPTVPFNLCKDMPPGDIPRQCHQPHYFKFRTDGIIEMYKKVWLLEQKTTARDDDKFWSQWHLNFQTRGYCYGVWKTTGVLVSGFLLNAIIKHSKQVTINGKRKYQLDPTNVGFGREPYIVTQEDLADFEHDIVGLANAYEDAFCDKAHNDKSLKIFKNTDACFEWNRKCQYYDLCKRGQVQLEGEFRTRSNDYVNNEYYTLLGLPIPEGDACQTKDLSVKTAV